MGKAPAVIIIARLAKAVMETLAQCFLILTRFHRHGARLDAEDKQWAANSPAPYDTPLSYGGWTQTRALGARIASLLHARDLASVDDVAGRRNSDTDGLGGQPSTTSTHCRRKQRLVIHTSPFLRCVQSSIAVAAGMAQYTGNLNKFEASNEATHTKPPRALASLSASQTRAQTLDAAELEERYDLPAASSPTPSTRPKTAAGHSTPTVPEIPKPTLRVDAFLGEWLSPDYFEFITPPPSSNMMVAAAKAELLKSAEPIHGAKLDVPENHMPQSWAGWGQYLAATTESPTSAFSMDELAENLPTTPGPSKHNVPGTVSSLFGYAPPTPLYALRLSEPIPTGYVAHARDSCVNIDFQWDSMHPPQNWGDGGEHGEEWSAMHNRFRQGIRNMVDWYKTEDATFDPQKIESTRSLSSDDDDEVILIMLTHGAGCNALIGALTNQPVLMDVGMASLTMAVHKNRYEGASPFRRPSLAPDSPSPSRRRRSSIDVGLSTEYEMKLIASSEHLRAGADPLKIPQLQASGLATIVEGGRRGSRHSPTSSGAATPIDLHRPRNSALGSIRRSTVTSRSSRSFTGMSTASQRSASPVPIGSASGLWAGGRRSSTATIEDEVLASPNAEAQPDPHDTQAAKSKENVSEPPTRSNTVWQPRTASGLSRAGSVGLWGTPPATVHEARARSTTISEKL